MKTCRTCLEEKPLSGYYYRADLGKLRTSCKTCEKRRVGLYYRKNSHEIAAKVSAKYYANPEPTKARAAKWYKENTERAIISTSAYQKANRSYLRPFKTAAAAKRRAAKIMATPSWLTEAHFAEITFQYEVAASLTLHAGTAFQVDHIIPLQGENVCGLHVPWNLMVTTARENRKKSNKIVKVGHYRVI